MDDLWSEIIQNKIHGIYMQVHNPYSDWYPQETNIEDIIKACRAMKIDTEELVRAHEAVKNSIHNLKVHAQNNASKMKYQSDKLKIKQVGEELT